MTVTRSARPTSWPGRCTSGLPSRSKACSVEQQQARTACCRPSRRQQGFTDHTFSDSAPTPSVDEVPRHDVLRAPSPRAVQRQQRSDTAQYPGSARRTASPRRRTCRAGPSPHSIASCSSSSWWPSWSPAPPEDRQAVAGQGYAGGIPETTEQKAAPRNGTAPGRVARGPPGRCPSCGTAFTARRQAHRDGCAQAAARRGSCARRAHRLQRAQRALELLHVRPLPFSF